ncbi:MAG: pilus assembly FimT family protein [Halanaerobiaceae bacterium]
MMIFNEENGFTLVEILVSITIIGIVLFAFSFMFLNGKLTLIITNNIHQALLSARQEVESAITTSNELTETLTVNFEGTPIEVQGNFLVGEKNYTANNNKEYSVSITYFKPGQVP